MSAVRPDPEETRVVLSTSPGMTRELGERLGKRVQPGDFIGFVGELGAGKTHFIRGLTQGAGVDESQVASPTFAIVYPYEGGRVPLYHADLYRLADYDELYATGFFDLAQSPGVMLVEWIDRVWAAAPRELLLLTFEHLEGQPEQRRLVARVWGARYRERLEQWLGGEGAATPDRGAGRPTKP